jgi:hypothetical protein
MSGACGRGSGSGSSRSLISAALAISAAETFGSLIVLALAHVLGDRDPDGVAGDLDHAASSPSPSGPALYAPQHCPGVQSHPPEASGPSPATRKTRKCWSHLSWVSIASSPQALPSERIAASTSRNSGSNVFRAKARRPASDSIPRILASASSSSANRCCRSPLTEALVKTGACVFRFTASMIVCIVQSLRPLLIAAGLTPCSARVIVRRDRPSASDAPDTENRFSSLPRFVMADFSPCDLSSNDDGDAAAKFKTFFRDQTN